MILTTVPPVDPVAVLKTARTQSKSNTRIRAQLISLSGNWLSHKLDDPTAVLGSEEALLVQKALNACGLPLPQPVAAKVPHPRTPSRPKIKRNRMLMEMTTSAPAEQVPLRGSALLQQVAADSSLAELMRQVHADGKGFGRMLQTQLTVTARQSAIKAIVTREGIHAHGTFTRLLSGQLSWTEVYVRDVLTAMKLTSQELLGLFKRFAKT